jgi:hypothetical protein
LVQTSVRERSENNAHNYIEITFMWLKLAQEVSHCPLTSKAHGGAVGWDTALQAGRSRVRFPMV